MSTYAGRLESASTFDTRTILERRPTRYAIGTVGFLAGVGSFILVGTSDHLVDPLEYGLLLADVIVGTAAVTVYWLVRRPGSRMAPILLALATAYVGIALQGASLPLLHSIGVLFDAFVFTLGYYAVFAFPHGRLVGALNKLVIAACVMFLLTSFLPWFLFSPVVSGGAPLAHCNADCPSNALMIADRPGIAAGLGRTVEILAVGVALLIVGTIAYRLRTAPHRQRRTLLPVYVPTLLLAIPFGIFHAAGGGLIDLSPETVSRVGWAVTAGRGTLSYGFLLSLVLASMFAGRALKGAVAGLGNTRHPAHLRSTLAAALDDPSLELAFRDGDDGFVDSSGERIDPARVDDRRSSTPWTGMAKRLPTSSTTPR